MPAWKPPKEHRHSTTWTRQVQGVLGASLGKTAVIAAVVWAHTRPHRGEDGAMQPGTRPGLKVQWGVPGGHLRWQAFTYSNPGYTERREDPANVADDIATSIREALRGGVTEKVERVRMSGGTVYGFYGVSPARTGRRSSQVPEDIVIDVSINPCSTMRHGEVWRALRNALVVGGFAIHDEGAGERMTLAELPPGRHLHGTVLMRSRPPRTQWVLQRQGDGCYAARNVGNSPGSYRVARRLVHAARFDRWADAANALGLAREDLGGTWIPHEVPA